MRTTERILSVKELSWHVALMPRPKSYWDGQTLFAVGDRDTNLFIVKSGKVEIVDYSDDELCGAARSARKVKL